MKSFILLFCISLLSLTAAQDLLSGKGDATFYYDVNGGGTCGPTNGITSYPSAQNYPLCETSSPDPKQLIDYDTNNIVAIPSALLFSNLDSYCGKKIIVTVDGVDRDDLDLVVWDGCVACNKNDGLGFSSTVFAELFGEDRCDRSRIQGEMSWRIVDEQVMPYGDQDQENIFQQKDEEDQENEDNVEVEIDVEVENKQEDNKEEDDLFIIPKPPIKEEEEQEENQENYYDQEDVEFEIESNEEDYSVTPQPIPIVIPIVVVKPEEEEQEYQYGATEEAVVVEEICLYCEKEEEEIVQVYPTPVEEEYVVPIYPSPEEEAPVFILYPNPEEEEYVKPVPVYLAPAEEESVVILYYAAEEEQVVAIPLYSAPQEEEVTYNPGNVLYPLEPEEEEYKVIYFVSTQNK